MTPRTWQRVKYLFSAAVDLPAADRAAYVHRETLDAPELAAEVLKLLALDPDAEDPIDRLTMPGELLQAASSRHRHYPGELLASRYEIRRFLAAGGSGEVYEAEDLERGERIAVKSLSREIPDGDHLAWLRREVGAARRISHRNVARVYDLVQSGSTVFLTMELLGGETLAARLKRHGAMTCREALPLIRQMVAGLAAAHAAGVVHRDLKPSNMMIVPRPDGPPRVVLTDFGLARPAPEDPQTTVRASSQVMGTPAYMAPEQVLGRAVKPAADIYALGVVIYEMLTGATPFAEESALTMAVRKTRGRPESPSMYAPGLRPSWRRVILRCLEPDPRRRFGDVSDVLAALEARSIPGQRWRLLKRRIGRRLVGRKSAQVALGVVAALGVVGAGAGWWWSRVTPTAAGLQAWEQGVASLRAGDPILAARLLEAGIREHRLPERARLDLALAWHRAGFAERAAQALPSRLIFSTDAVYEQAVRAQLNGETAKALAAIRQRAKERPRDAAAAADLASWEPTATAAQWQRVLDLEPGNVAAHLQLAERRAAAERWPEAERGYLTAQTFAGGAGNRDLVRFIAGRRGLARLKGATNLDTVRAEMLPFAQLPAAYGAAPCERKVVLQEGLSDNFDLQTDERPHMSAALLRMMEQSGFKFRQFDEQPDNRPFGVSFPLPPVKICAAQLMVRIRQNVLIPNAINDALVMGLAPFDKVKVSTALWTKLPQIEDQVFVFDLNQETFAAAQVSFAATAAAWFDVYLSDDTAIDYAKLTLIY